jgi:hypothetical protein
MPDPTPNPNPNPAPNPSIITQEPGSEWRTSLPEDIRGEKSFESFKGKDVNEVFPQLAKSFLETKKMVGSRVHVGADAKPEELEKFKDIILTKFGRPETPEKYELKRPQLPEGMKYNDGREKEFLKAAHSAGYTKAQAQVAIDFYNAGQEQMYKDALVANSKATEALKAEWGESYPKNYELAKRAFSQIKGMAPGLEAKLVAMNMDNDPDVVKAFSFIGQMMAEHSLIEGEGLGTMSIEEAQTKLNELQNNIKGPLYDLNHKDHDSAAQERIKLLNILSGGKKWEMQA